MKFLNLIVGSAAAVAFIAYLRGPITPPDDPWFQAAVLNQSDPVLVKFGAEWCGPCRSMDRVLNRFTSQSGGVKVVRIDIDQKRDLARHFRVSSIPRIYLFLDGQIIGSSGGFANVDQLEEWIESRLR